MKFGILLLASLLFAPLLAGAQFDTFSPQNTLVLTPAYPEPGQSVQVELNDYAGGLFGSEISWRYNGEPLPEVANQRSIELTAGAVGSTGVVEAVLTTAQGITQTLSATINPVYLDVIIEPQTRVPDWYEGRALPSIGSQINATALVNDGSMVDPAGLVYTWRVNRTVLEGGPVRGRNKMSFQTPRGPDFLLSVTVSRAGGQVIASKLTKIDSVSPELRFYEQHPLYGTLETPLTSDQVFVGNTLAVVAEPYYLDTRVYNDPDVAIWEINGFETDNGARNPYEITLSRGATTGQTNLNFHVRSLREILQGVETNIALNF